MLTNLRKRTALLLSLAVVCATVALVPQAANAGASKVPNAGTPLSTPADPYTAPASTTTNKTCPGTSAPAAGFTDTTATDVDCIKMYGITTGKTATTYDPSGTISRQDMARFIHRMFVPTGMAAAGATAVPAFTDMPPGADAVAAINALASHGITTGTTATTFSPDDLVTRDQMALFMFRFAQLVRPYDNSAAVSPGLTMSIATGAYNYSDIATQSFEAMEAIIGLYNLGALGETCTSLTLTTCGTTYRPTENITRLEMAQMLVGVLNHTNARPAGATVQTSSAVTATTEATSISYRNAAFEPVANVYVDTFGQVRDDTSATTKAISVPFVAILNTASSAAGGVTGVGTVGTVDTADKLTNSKGNVVGMPLTLTSPSTGRWWVHASPQGTIYVDGTTVGFLFEASVAAGAGTTFATTATHAWDKTQALVSNFGGSIANVTSTTGSHTYQGTSRTLTTTLTGATTAAVVDGYTIKYVDKVVNYGGGTGNQTVSYVTTYVPSSGGKVSLTVTCGADPLPLTNNVVNDGAADALDYYESHEITLTFATAAATNGWPTGGSDPTDAGVTAPALSCDDVARAYTAGSTGETVTVGQNYADVSTAGTLATITATAFDQYGLGVSGVTAGFRSTTVTNVARTAAASVGPTARSVLTTGADGTAVLTAVVCTANGSVAWSIETDDGVMDDIAATVPAAGAVEGSTVYCTTAGADGVTATTATSNVTAVAEVQTLTFYNNGVAANPSAASFVITFAGEACDTTAHGDNDAAIEND